MTEREELIIIFDNAMPVIQQLAEEETTSAKYHKLIKQFFILFIACFFLGMAISTIISAILPNLFIGFFPILAGIILPFFLKSDFKRKFNTAEANILKIQKDESISFIPLTYRNSFEMIQIYRILSDMRADTLKEAFNIWEQDKHNMVMEMKEPVNFIKL